MAEPWSPGPGIETDYLTGEIVLLGRLHGVATPVNALLQHWTNCLAATGSKPGSITPHELAADVPPTSHVSTPKTSIVAMSKGPPA